MGAGEGADRPHIGVGVHHARLHQGGAHQIGALGDAGRSEAVAGPGEGVRADGDAGRGVRHRHGGEDLHGAVPAGVSRRRATADTGANTRSRGPGRPPLRCQRTRRSPRASWPANSMVAVPSSTTTTTSGARVMVSSSCTYRENGSPRTTRRARRRGHGEAAYGAQRGARAPARLLPADVVPLLAGQLRHAAELAAGHRVDRGQHHEGESRAGRVGVRPLQHVEQLDRTLHEGERAGAGAAGAGAHRRTTVPVVGVGEGGSDRHGLAGGRGDLRLGDHAGDPAQLLHRAELGLVDLLHAVAEGGLDGADVADQTLQALRLDGGCLVGAPHGAVEGDVALDEAGAEGDRAARVVWRPVSWPE